MKRLSISISNSLHSRLEPFKNKFNVSGLCQKAILQEVEVQEALQFEELQELHDLIGVLRRGKVSFKKQWVKRGFEDAVEQWVDLPVDSSDNASLYEQFLLIVENGILPPEVIEDMEHEIEDSKEDDNPIICDWESYEQGYLEGARNIFDRIRDKLEGKKFKLATK